MGKVLLSLSGGVDSTTLLAWLLAGNSEVTAISFKYGSKHNKYENEAARQLAHHYGVELIELDIQQAMINIQSNLLSSGGAIPEGHYEEESMKSTVVPARNMIFLSIMAGIAESRGLEGLAIGVHSGDHAIYPDCRPEFITSMTKSVQLATDNQVQFIMAPFIDYGKGKIIQTGIALPRPVPYRLTRTCYTDQPLACGKCGSCVERLEAFQVNGITDPIQYETDAIGEI